MDELREKCPWDKKQTMESLRHLTIEEMYELSDAIIDGNSQGIREELGDLFLHLIFYSKIAEEKEAFNIADVLNDECEKLIRRHPHIYGNLIITDEKEVKKNWEKLKLKEGKKSILQGVPRSLPALVKAYRIQEKVKQVGFEWENIGQVWEKVHEELNELAEQTKKENNQSRINEEFGDVMFAMINLARYLGLDPEETLERTNKKFVKRFQFIEQEAKTQNKSLDDMSLSDMDEIWKRSKKEIG